MRDVVEGPLLGIAERFSRFLAPVWPHTALVIFTRKCTGRPRKVSGDPEILGRVSIAELEVVRDALEPGVAFDGGALIAGRR
ncbi:MAG TPA: helix-turn-helix transcriptional regulator, partial [Aldersonia sp.]